jgi:hypothetical protein
MASFFSDLWESIFTPGPTPTLLIATNASFAALQLLFLALLVATYSIHFVILSLLTGGLWWGINWFAREIQAAQAKEEEAKRIRGARRESKEGGGEGGVDADVDTGDDTEVDTTPAPGARKATEQSTVFVDKAGSGASTTGASTRLAPLVDGAVKRKSGLGESTGDLSTDSEWDKLSEDSGEK